MFIAVIHLALFGAIGIDSLGLEIPILRQFIGFIYLTFIPGIILLRIFRIHKIGNIKTILYSVGLSIAFLMLIGLVMNTLYPLLGISKPLSFLPLIITISAITLILTILSYVRDKDFSISNYIDTKEILSPKVLFLILLPFLSILGSCLVNSSGNNSILLLLIIIICSIIVIAAFSKKLIPEKFYPLAIWSISLSLIFHLTLISQYLTGYDIHVEFYLFKLVEDNSYWDSTIRMSVNAMLGITIVPVIFSKLLNVNGVWIFKIVYPFIFSLLPLGLFHIFKQQTDGLTAFLATFFFMGLQRFPFMMATNARQGIAELFFILLVLLLLDRELKPVSRSFLAIIFSFALIVSHYGTSYIYMIYIALIWLFLFLRRDISSKLNGTSVAIFFVMSLSWYMYLSQSAPFTAIVNLGDHLFSSIYTDFFLSLEEKDPVVLQAIGMGGATTTLHYICRGIHYLTQFFIVIGVIMLVGRKVKFNFDKEYVPAVYVSIFLLLSSIILPHSSTSLGQMRIYHITLIFLAPFCIIGAKATVEGALKLLAFLAHFFQKAPLLLPKNGNSSNTSFKFLIVSVLILFFLFQSGFIWEVSNDPGRGSMALSYDKMKYELIHDQDIASVKWLSNVKEDSECVYASPRRIRWRYYYGIPPEELRVFSLKRQKGYFHITCGEDAKGEMTLYEKYEPKVIDLRSSEFLQSKDKIYDCGAQIYYSER